MVILGLQILRIILLLNHLLPKTFSILWPKYSTIKRLQFYCYIATVLSSGDAQKVPDVKQTYIAM